MQLRLQHSAAPTMRAVHRQNRRPLHRPPASARSPALDALLGSQRLLGLERSEADCADLCREQEAGGDLEGAQRCWEAHAHLRRQHSGAQAACVREMEEEGTDSGPGCRVG